MSQSNRLARRAFIKSGSAVIASASLANSIVSSNANAQRLPEDITQYNAASVRELAMTGLDAARSAGAAYADIVFRFVHKEEWRLWLGTSYPQPLETFTIGVGIRALVETQAGISWGFAGFDGMATGDVTAGLGRSAALRARSSMVGSLRQTDLSSILAPAPIAVGKWVMPVEIDPFTVSSDEKIDFISAMNDYALRQRWDGVGTTYSAPMFTKEERIFASTEGSFTEQTLYTTQSTWTITAERHFKNERDSARSADFLTPAGAGWEYIRNAPYQDKAQELIEQAMRSRYGKAIDVGRYDVVFDAYSMAHILDTTIAPATELDRAFGYEANSVGTSFLNDPLEMLGTYGNAAYKVGSNLVNITANRSMPQGAATVKWDDEGVEPDDVTLVKEGLLEDFQTTRESAVWLSEHYNKVGKPVKSNGCSGHHKASLPPTHWSPNLAMLPAQDSTTFNDLVADTKRGLAVIGGYSFSDSQALNGSGRAPLVYEIRDGKLGEVVLQSSYLYRATELWKNVVALGGKDSVRSFGIERARDYRYSTPHTVQAVPAKVTGVAMIDTERKA